MKVGLFCSKKSHSNCAKVPIATMKSQRRKLKFSNSHQSAGPNFPVTSTEDLDFPLPNSGAMSSPTWTNLKKKQKNRFQRRNEFGLWNNQEIVTLQQGDSDVFMALLAKQKRSHCEKPISFLSLVIIYSFPNQDGSGSLLAVVSRLFRQQSG